MSTILEMQIEELQEENNALKALNQKLQVEKNEIKEQLFLGGVGCSKITALVTYWIWQDAEHPMLDDYKETFTEIVEVEKILEINKLFKNILKVEIIK